MRLLTLLFTVMLATKGVAAQEATPSPAGDQSATAAAASPAKDAATKDESKPDLPVSVDRIRKALEQTPDKPLVGLHDTPTFRIEIQERNRLQELISTLDFGAGGPTPGAGIYASEMQRLMGLDRPAWERYADWLPLKPRW